MAVFFCQTVKPKTCSGITGYILKIFFKKFGIDTKFYPDVW